VTQVGPLRFAVHGRSSSAKPERSEGESELGSRKTEDDIAGPHCGRFVWREIEDSAPILASSPFCALVTYDGLRLSV